MRRWFLIPVLSAALLAQPVDSGAWKQTAQKQYANSEFEELQRFLTKVALDHGSDPEVLCLLGLVELRQGRLPQAKEALLRLQRFGGGAGKEKLESRLAALINQQEKMEPQRQAIRQALLQSDEAKARGLIRGMDIAPFQREVLETYLDLYAGHFVRVEDHLRTLSKGERAEEAAVIKQVQSDLNRARSSYSALVWFRQGYWLTKEAEDAAKLLEIPVENWLVTFNSVLSEFTKTGNSSAYQAALTKIFAIHVAEVRDLLHACPLDDFALDAAFNLALVTQKYEDLEAFGDSILARKGTLRLDVQGAVTNHRMGALVVDARRREVYPATWGAGPRFPGEPEHVPEKTASFRLAFQEITSIDQEPRFITTVEGLRITDHKNGTLLRLNGKHSFRTGNWLNFANKALGELATRQVMQNLGRYLAHAVNLPASKTKLAEVKVGGGTGFFNVMMAIGTVSSVVAGNSTNAAIFTQADAQDRAQREAQADWARTMLSSWNETIGNQAMRNLFQPNFGELESLLAVAQ